MKISDQDSLQWHHLLLLDMVEVGMLVIDGDTLLFANKAFSRAVNMTLKELQAFPLKELAGEAWVEFTLGKSWADALPWPMRNGGERWFEVSLCPEIVEARPVQIATCIDVTSKMRAEGAEANMLQMITEIIESNPVGTFVIDRDHAVTHWNRACEMLTGASAIDMVGSEAPWQAFGEEKRPLLADLVMAEVDEESIRADYQGRFWKSQAADGAYEAEAFFPKMGTRGRWLRLAATPLRNAGGDVVGAIQTLIDITERMNIEQMLAETIGGAPVGIFVMDNEHTITHWNRVCEAVTGIPAEAVIGHRSIWSSMLYDKYNPVLADLVVDGASEEEIINSYNDRECVPSSFFAGAWQLEIFMPKIRSGGAWLQVTVAPLRSAGGQLVGAIETLIDITDRKRAEEELRTAHLAAENLVQERTRELVEAKAELEDDVARRQIIEEQMQQRLKEITELNIRLHDAQGQLVQNEKLASIGQLAAGVAHEINNPIGYVFSNFGSLQSYLKDLLRLLDAFVAAESVIASEEVRDKIVALRKEIDLDYLKEDIIALMTESREGIERVRKIVQDLKDFSHVDASADWQWADLHKGLDSTLNVVNNEIKYRADVVREFGNIPRAQCLPSQLNQVFMNLLVNAAHAMEGLPRGTITVRTGTVEDKVWIEISDTGCGIPSDVINRIFDPFFTTKPIGKGTGLGLSLSYGIIQKHHGKLDVNSAPGKGTTFRITLPINQPLEAEGAVA
jgi:two-component system, NtrC family, sensor kinase